MPSFGIHSSFHHTEPHPVETTHPTESKSSVKETDKPGSSILKPGTNPFTQSSSGLPTNSTPKKSTLKKVTWPNQEGDYVVNTKDAPDANGSRPVYKLDDVGTRMPTNERAKQDEHGNFKRVDGTDAAKPASSAALPPAAKVDPRTLTLNKESGVYQPSNARTLGGDDRSYVRVGDSYYQVKQGANGWAIVDPNKAHTVAGSVYVKLDGKGGAEPLAKAGLKGGEPAAPPLRQQVLESREAAVQAYNRLDLARDEAEQARHAFDESTRQLEDHQAQARSLVEDIEILRAQDGGLEGAYQREQDPVKRERIQQERTRIQDELSSKRDTLNKLNSDIEGLNQKIPDDRKAVVRAEKEVENAVQSLDKAGILFFHHLAEYVMANPDDAEGFNMFAGEPDAL
ncbi:hypothetical protein [Dyella nitratireducens]|uniref:Uncharacterized protein n=1 Tax=Dyella nitratireducens TaxID=1849580 RepID=A0ABQ1FKK7_9GAMM|nr:hypothetical protein [Dyella nitratireducens]GGA17244.1 hypothetical protein GCM10010981_01220 [Dyella nitratireducens]GLQ44817.1 hypothetical protein GCM10007902_46670 [Dyella nitratireducens]